MNLTSASTAQATDGPLGQIIQERQTLLGVSDVDLAARLGFHKVLALEMIKTGQLRLPLVKAPLLATALGVGVWEVLRLAADRPTFDFLESLGTSGG